MRQEAGGGEGKDILEDAARSVARTIRNTFSRERKVRKLYQQWTEFADLPPDEVPSFDKLRQLSAEEKAKIESVPDEEDED